MNIFFYRVNQRYWEVIIRILNCIVNAISKNLFAWTYFFKQFKFKSFNNLYATCPFTFVSLVRFENIKKFKFSFRLTILHLIQQLSPRFQVEHASLFLINIIYLFFLNFSNIYSYYI